MIQYINKTNRKLAFFLQSLRYMDSVSSAGEKDKSFKELDITYNEIIDQVRLAYMEKESLNHYLNKTVEHVGVGLISFNDSGEVEIINRAARILLNIRYLKNIRSLNKVKEGLPELLFDLENNQQKLVSLNHSNEILKIAIKATTFQLQDKNLKLISFQNIQSELDASEVDAWQKLIRVLTHEIMNSITPISSLASTANRFLMNAENDPSKLEPEDIEDITTAVKTIEKRSQGLLKFVKSYRKVTRIPKPEFHEIKIIDLFSRIDSLVKELLGNNNISFSSQANPDIVINADLIQVEQVIINLTKNSIEALKNIEEGRIKLAGKYDLSDRPVIQIIDNGPGIDEEVLQNIFIPFFSTKEEGSGIGLSLSRQIMRVHNGNLSVKTEPNVETVFTLQF